MLDISFLGTGTSQGVPIIGSDHPVCLSSDKRDKRLRVSVLIPWEDFNIVIDYLKYAFAPKDSNDPNFIICCEICL